MPRAPDDAPNPSRRPSRRARSIPTNVLVPAAHREALKRLAARTRVSQSEYLREAVADLLEKYQAVLDEDGADGISAAAG